MKTDASRRSAAVADGQLQMFTVLADSPGRGGKPNASGGENRPGIASSQWLQRGKRFYKRQAQVRKFADGVDFKSAGKLFIAVVFSSVTFKGRRTKLIHCCNW
jgi:hypothetical protein